MNNVAYLYRLDLHNSDPEGNYSGDFQTCFHKSYSDLLYMYQVNHIHWYLNYQYMALQCARLYRLFSLHVSRKYPTDGNLYEFIPL